jgi:uncharacterized protein with NRDE domain
MAMAWQLHPKLPLVLGANRDEFHDRESVPMAWWDAQGQASGRVEESWTFSPSPARGA